MMRALVLPLVMMLAAWAVGGCSALSPHAATQYTTVVADPHRDEAKAIAKTEQAAKLFEKGKCERAEEALQEALVADVMYGPAHNNLGRLYYEQRKYYLAAWEFEYAAKTMSDRPEPYNNLGMVYEAVDRIDQAIAQYSKAHGMAPQNPEYLGNLARALLKKDEHSPEARPLLSDLLLYDTRPTWVRWARETLAVGKLPPTSKGPETVATPAPESSILPVSQSPAQPPDSGEAWVADPSTSAPLRYPNVLGPDLPKAFK
jgi:Flp pilus assembly protein TadD